MLINATPAGTEALKNLILPGVGFITILDDKLIEERDLGNNFFITEESIGKSRAEETVKNLLELNDDVKGDFIHEASGKYLNSGGDIDFFKQFSLVIAWDITDNEFKNLTEISDKFNMPIIVMRTYGMIGYLRSYRKEHTCIQSKHADKEPEDLRMAAPFESLETYVRNFDLNALDNMEHKHTPYAIIVIKAVLKWKEDHGGKLPTNMTEKEEFKASIKSMARNFHDELNFIEAIDNAYKVFSYEPIPFEIQEILDDEKANSSDYHSKFWSLVSALKQFVDENGWLPVSGKIPDMVSTSDFYITLQRIYQKKAVEDRERISSILSKQAEDKGLMDIIFDENEVKTFCENARLV